MSEDLEPRQAAEMLAGGSTQLVDVRRPDEHEAGRIAGDVHIELDRLAEEAGRLDSERPVLFYCRVGARSAMAADAFAAAGFTTYNLAGGLEAWVANGLPIEPEDGYVA